MYLSIDTSLFLNISCDIFWFRCSCILCVDDMIIADDDDIIII